MRKYRRQAAFRRRPPSLVTFYVFLPLFHCIYDSLSCNRAFCQGFDDNLFLIHQAAKRDFSRKYPPKDSLKQAFFRRANAVTAGIHLYFKGAIGSCVGKGRFTPVCSAYIGKGYKQSHILSVVVLISVIYTVMHGRR